MCEYTVEWCGHHPPESTRSERRRYPSLISRQQVAGIAICCTRLVVLINSLSRLPAAPQANCLRVPQSASAPAEEDAGKTAISVKGVRRRGFAGGHQGGGQQQQGAAAAAAAGQQRAAEGIERGRHSDEAAGRGRGGRGRTGAASHGGGGGGFLARCGGRRPALAGEDSGDITCTRFLAAPLCEMLCFLVFVNPLTRHMQCTVGSLFYSIEFSASLRSLCIRSAFPVSEARVDRTAPPPRAPRRGRGRQAADGHSLLERREAAAVQRARGAPDCSVGSLRVTVQDAE